MAIVWLLLKIILWILLGLLGLIVFLLLLPVTVELRYSAREGFAAVLRVLGIRVKTLSPEAQMQEEPEAPSEEKQESEPQPPKDTPKQTEVPQAEKGLQGLEKQAGPEPQQEQSPVEKGIKAPPKEQTQTPQTASLGAESKRTQKTQASDTPMQTLKKSKSGAEKNSSPPEDDLQFWLNHLGELLSIAGGTIRRLLWGLRIHQIRIYLPIFAEDAAATAIRVGQIHGGLGASLGMLQNFLRLSFRELRIEPDYTGERQNEAFFSCKITASLIIIVVAAVWALPKLLRLLKQKNMEQNG